MDIINRRVEIFVKKLLLDEERVLAWAFCHAILSAWWCIEDHGDGVEDAIKTAMMFETLLMAK